MSAAHASPSAQSPILKLPLTHSKCRPDQVAQDTGSGLCKATLCVPGPRTPSCVSAPCSSFSPTLRTLHSLPFRIGNLCSLRAQQVSLWIPLCVFCIQSPKTDTGLRAMLSSQATDSCPGSRLQVWSPQLWSEPRLHGGAGPQQRSSRPQQSCVCAGVSSEPLTSRITQRCQALGTLRQCHRQAGTEADQSEHCSQSALH